MGRSILGIRREDKNRWERRVPLTPEIVRNLVGQGYEVLVQPSPRRIYPDEQWTAAGARLAEDLAPAGVVLGVKEMPVDFFRTGTAYVFFSHVIKGQPHNMPMLRQLLARGATLLDYEKITDAQGRRLVFFGRHARLAGAIDSLWALGRRFESEHLATPFSALEPAHRYPDLAAAKRALGGVGARVRLQGLPPALVPFVVGVTGYGHVAGGAEAVDPQPGHRSAPGPAQDAGQAQRTVADDAGAQERRGLEVGKSLRDRVAEIRRHPDALGEAPVPGPACEVGIFAKILPVGAAETAGAAGAVEPGRADPLAGPDAGGARAAFEHPADDLMPGNDGQAPRRQVALDHVQIGAADPADADAKQHLAGAGTGFGKLAQHERRRLDRGLAIENPGAHGKPPGTRIRTGRRRQAGGSRTPG
jgi:hypothetical protein